MSDGDSWAGPITVTVAQAVEEPQRFVAVNCMVYVPGLLNVIAVLIVETEESPPVKEAPEVGVTVQL